jgi:hypothetical protein
MVYFKRFISGIAATILAALLFEVILLALSLIQLPRGLYWDWRWIVAHYWYLSTPAAAVAFVLGFLWKRLRAAK